MHDLINSCKRAVAILKEEAESNEWFEEHDGWQVIFDCEKAIARAEEFEEEINNLAKDIAKELLIDDI